LYVLEHIEAAAHIAIERRVADAHLALVAVQHHGPNLLEIAIRMTPRRATDVFFRRVGALLENVGAKRVAERIDQRLRSARYRS